MVWQVLLDVLEVREHLSEQSGNVGIIHFIKNLVGCTSRPYQTQAPQASQVVRDCRWGNPGDLGQGIDALFALCQRKYDARPRGIAQGGEIIGDKTGLLGG